MKGSPAPGFNDLEFYSVAPDDGIIGRLYSRGQWTGFILQRLSTVFNYVPSTTRGPHTLLDATKNQWGRENKDSGIVTHLKARSKELCMSSRLEHETPLNLGEPKTRTAVGVC